MEMDCDENGNGQTDSDGQWTTMEVDGGWRRWTETAMDGGDGRRWTTMEMAMEEWTETTTDGDDNGDGQADGDNDGRRWTTMEMDGDGGWRRGWTAMDGDGDEWRWKG
mmetsp:Transcript_6749/g.14621  ORF Transcript_6749/g.14621 Transcript_6749/m.14621 type:complete len:108 (+) Transcript_6749:241-564(+)